MSNTSRSDRRLRLIFIAIATFAAAIDIYPSEPYPFAEEAEREDATHA